MKLSSTPAATNQTLLLHALIQYTASRHWMDYVDDLGLQIEKLVRISLPYNREALSLLKYRKPKLASLQWVDRAVAIMS